MWQWLPIPLMYLSLALLIRAEERTPPSPQQIKVWKPLCTLLVILIAALSFTGPYESADRPYSALVLTGLGFSLIGDVLLIFQENAKAFMWGLVAFLVAHLMYIAAFVYLQTSVLQAQSGGGELVSAIVLVVVGASVYRYLSPGLGKMRTPVIAYIVVISAMVHRATAIALIHPGPATQPILILAGAVLFYISDAILAANKFRMGGRMPHYRLWNLTTYYTGQLLIALSTWFVCQGC
jgi:uncharacterized membrane protein YhhN